MTPKEKAIELVSTVDYLVNGDINERNKKDVALWCVHEMRKENLRWIGSYVGKKRAKELKEVQKEIEKL